ncbi:MAG: MarR family transcriptional regulator [Anaerolineae bacterium]|nr:MAG: MarR family transcriptional regulator [Anaerolineae bacterium]
MAFDLEDDLGFLIARTHRAMRRWLTSRLEAMGITFKQFRVLNALGEEENVSQTALAERLDMDKSSLARMLDRMEKAGLISRCADLADSRVNRVRLTRKGRHLQSRVTPQRDLGLSWATEGLTGGEVKELKRMLNVIYRKMSS